MRFRSLIVLLVGSAALAVPVPVAGAAAPHNIPRPTPRGIPAPATPGEQMWVERYNSALYQPDIAYALTVSPDGSIVFVTGFTSGNSTTVAYSASTGTKLWGSSFPGFNGGALGMSPDGSTLFVGGAIFSFSTYHWDYATVAYSASSGAELWVRRYNGPANLDDTLQALGVSPGGSTVFVTGRSTASNGQPDYATVAYRASTGRQLWVRRYNGSGNSDDSARALGVSPDGSTVYVTGWSMGSTSIYDYATVAYSASSGAKLWGSRYNGPANGLDWAWALGVSPDGSTVFVTGQSSMVAGSGNYDYITLAYSAATGTKLWGSHYDGPGSSGDEAFALGVSPDGSTVFVTGASDQSPFENGDYATVAYSASTGTELWVSRYDGPGGFDDQAHALGVSPDGSTVFVTGYSYGSTAGYDYATVACDASTGNMLWVSRYNGPGNAFDLANALEVSPDGSMVFVTGSSIGSDGSEDYATAAYSTI